MNIKKIIAREGLIILGIIFISVLCLNSSTLFFRSENMGLTSTQLESLSQVDESKKLNAPSDKEFTLRDFVTPEMAQKEINRRNIVRKFNDVGIFLIFASYPIYLLFRFIIWAIRTLREKE